MWISIDLYRRKSFRGEKIHWRPIPSWVLQFKMLAELWRFAILVGNSWRYDLLVGCHIEYHGVMAWLAGTVWRKPVIQLIIGDVDWAMSRRWFRRAIMSAAGCGVRGNVGLDQLRAAGYAGPAAVIANPYSPPAAGEGETGGNRYYDLICVAGCVPIERAPLAA